MKITRERFRLPKSVTKKDAAELLWRYYQTEVYNRHEICKYFSALQEVIYDIADYLTSDNDKTGIILMGRYGNGKTTMVRAIQKMVKDFAHDYAFSATSTNFGIDFSSACEIGEYFRKNGKGKLFDTELLAIDDLGVEATEEMNYGTIISPIRRLLEYRYENRLFTIITTNLTPGDIREKYGERIADRFNDMMHKVNFSQIESYR